MALTLRDLLAEVRKHCNLVHVSPKANVPGIVQHGICSPAEAQRRGIAATFGSEESNVNVVQLLDYRNLPLGQAYDQLVDLLESHPASIEAWAIFTIDPKALEHPNFLNHWHVGRMSREGGADWRYYPETEVWIAKALLESTWISGIWIVKRSGREWKVTPRKGESAAT